MLNALVKAGFELFDHTADMGIRVLASTLPELLAPAGEGLYAVIGELVPGDETQAGRAAEPLTVELHGDDPAVLLRDYLNELLIIFERDARLVTAIDRAEFDERHLSITARTAPLDSRRSTYFREVKAITYHELDIRAMTGGYQATIIVDI